MSKTSLQYHTPKQGASFTAASVSRPTPGPNEICIRTKAVALNGLDWKSRDSGVMVQSWPAVLGMDTAGFVDSVGASFKDSQPGDEVFSLCGHDIRAGAFQEIIMFTSKLLAKKLDSLTFEEAASLQVCYLTAASAITFGLHVPLPPLDPTGSSFLKSIPVLGGSSVVGAAAIQLLRLALTILTTSSAKHLDDLSSLGATKYFERSAQEDLSAIKAATSARSSVDAGLDAVAAAANQPAIFAALDPNGRSFTSKSSLERMLRYLRESTQLLLSVDRSSAGVESLLQSGKYKLPTKVEVVEKGFAAIGEDLNKLMEGVRGTKYVVNM